MVQASDVRAARAELQAVARVYPRGVAMVSIVSPAVRFGVLDDATRTEAQLLMSSRDIPIVASAVVFETRGFGGAILGGIVSGIALVAGPSRPIRVFTEVSLAEQWLAEQMGSLSLHRAGELTEAVAAQPW